LTHSIHHQHIVEAQQIRNAKTDFNKAVMSIDAKHKWALTGTPFVNKPDDIQSLLQWKLQVCAIKRDTLPYQRNCLWTHTILSSRV
jgi:SNF2 family DNA or RNA helicase